MRSPPPPSRSVIQVEQGTKTFNFQIENFNNTNPAAAQYTDQWAMSNWGEYGTTPYPTEEDYFNTDGSSNMGAYADPATDTLIDSAIYGKHASTATTVADHLAKDVPMLFLPCADVIDAVSNKVGGTTTHSWR